VRIAVRGDKGEDDYCVNVFWEISLYSGFGIVTHFSGDDEMSWNYMVLPLVLKCPCNSDKLSRDTAFELLKKEVSNISPAFIHEVGKIIIVSTEKLNNGHKDCVNVNDQRDCGCK